MTTLFTPGPWKWHAQGDANDYAMLTADGRWVISFRQNGELLTAQQEANAQLMATAPEMLAALQAGRRKLATYQSVYAGDKELRKLLADWDAAIAQATKTVSPTT